MTLECFAIAAAVVLVLPLPSRSFLAVQFLGVGGGCVSHSYV